jgi:hypothetical protein
MNKDKIILDLCGGTGAWSQPYKEAGYNVKLITLPNTDITKVDFRYDFISFHIVGGDTENYISQSLYRINYKDIYGILAAPTCTQFSRARTTAKTPRNLKEGMYLVRACMDIIWKTQEVQGMPSLQFWALENPMGVLRRFLGRPDYSFNPYDFGDRYSKQTDLWGWFNKPVKKPIKLTKSEIELCRKNNRKMPSMPSHNYRARRSITPPGFAQAFFKANK